MHRAVEMPRSDHGEALFVAHHVDFHNATQLERHSVRWIPADAKVMRRTTTWSARP